ncbi:MAG: hypothetical protein CVV27_06465 [Candidatus Melainabacteria bacterium HGW-Melainabacteria-1]|nr:MAG: hypothetical protein CVV27_06465 [Candidatus Melainabacteria bacterium HGW-Melainabacteria-1]
MDTLTLLIVTLIFSLALVQSLFGVGLLLLGTPLLLALGLGYEQTLLWLLPASAALSWSQVWELRNEKLANGYRARFFGLCMPVLLLALALSLHLDLLVPIKWLVLGLLCLSIALRLKSSWFEQFKRLLAGHLSLGLIVTGLIHGLSNMGGSVLTVLAAGLYARKRQVLAAVSLDYAFMASAQLGLLLLLKPALWSSHYLLGSALALLARYLIGRQLFALTQDGLYQQLITLLLALNAGLLGWTLLGMAA